jgi:dipeptidase E
MLIFISHLRMELLKYILSMKKKLIFILFTICFCEVTSCQNLSRNCDSDNQVDKKILVYGNGMDKVFINYVIKLTDKRNPRVCFFPTAAADDERVISYWYRICSDLPLTATVLKTFISSSPGQKTFEEEILDVDAIIVGGGNTLNMLAIWKAQGIDTLLRMAYDKGIVLSGGSAGSLCWFTGGYTDSRPRELSLIKCLGFLDYSHSPHYDKEPARRTLYLQAISDGTLKPGYACDDEAGLLFVNGKMIKSVSLNSNSHNYYVSMKDGKPYEEELPAEIIK